jgi:copper homeostasis protein
MRDLARFEALGVEGVVFGFLGEDGTVDVPRCRALVEAAGGLRTIFHRAFDLTEDASRALEAISSCGISRVLTSGHRATAPMGSDEIGRLILQAEGRVQIMAGGGVRPVDVPLLRAKGVRHFHASASEEARDGHPSKAHVRFGLEGFQEGAYLRVSRHKVQQLRAALNAVDVRVQA